MLWTANCEPVEQGLCWREWDCGDSNLGSAGVADPEPAGETGPAVCGDGSRSGAPRPRYTQAPHGEDGEGVEAACLGQH